jgi:hypothetical protein
MRPIMERNLASRFFTGLPTAPSARRALEAAGGINRRYPEMMMTHIKTALFAAALALTTLGAAAQHERWDDRDDQRYDERHQGRTATPQIDRVMAEQAQRIQWGLRGGALTHVEARHLRRQQFQIVRVKQRALSDGHVSGVERRQLRDLQAQAAQDIERALRNARYDDQRRYPRG